MAKAIQVEISDLILENSVNHVFVTVYLEKYWEEILKQNYIFLKVQLTIPVLERGESGTISLELRKEYFVPTLSEQEKMATLSVDLKEKFDADREASAQVELLMYNKS